MIWNWAKFAADTRVDLWNHYLKISINKSIWIFLMSIPSNHSLQNRPHIAVSEVNCISRTPSTTDGTVCPVHTVATCVNDMWNYTVYLWKLMEPIVNEDSVTAYNKTATYNLSHTTGTMPNLKVITYNSLEIKTKWLNK